MKHKQNIASQVIDAWQKQFQDCLDDPRLADLMVENYARFQENLSSAINANQPSADPSLSDDVIAKLDELGNRISKLERSFSQLKKLQKYINSGPKAKSRKLKASA